MMECIHCVSLGIYKVGCDFDTELSDKLDSRPVGIDGGSVDACFRILVGLA